MTDRPWETDLAAHAELRILHRSPKYTVAHAYESVVLVGDNLPRSSIPLPIGDFYGDPEASAIDVDERWCVTVGCGLIAYRLAPPWTPYGHSTVQPGGQWWEFGNGADPTWLRSVSPINSGVFIVHGENHESAIVDCWLRTVGRAS